MGKYEEALANLNDAQRQAVTTIDGPVLVIAGPGTGKTQLLATRIAYILSNTDTLPENILCLTFTESAAQNMRQRLTSLIGQAAYKVTISTYHAFGSDLIKRFGDYFVTSAELEPIDDLGIDRIFREIIASLPFSSPLKAAEMYLNDVKTFVSDAKRALLQPQDLRALITANQAFIDIVQPIVRETLDGLVRMTDKTAVERFQKLANRLIELPGNEPPKPINKQAAFSKITQLGQLFTRSLHEALDDVVATGKKQALTQWKNQWLAKDQQGHFIADGTKINQKLLALADVYQQYIERLEQEHLFDYDDMILQAIQVLQTHDDLRFTLQEQYLYVLLDEFQDTNGAQLRLVELLTDNPVYEQRPNVLAVGDDDQAIYAFQGADYSHMLQFQQQYRDVVLIPLVDNYRSHADILRLAEGIAGQIKERLHHHFPDIKKDLRAQAANLPEHAVIERWEMSSEAGQLAWTTQKIKKLLSNGMSATDIAILAPQHKHLEPLVGYLRAQDINVHYDKRENVLDDPAIIQLLQMSQLVLHLHTGQLDQANALWAEVLSYSFWQLPTSLIWQLSWQANDEDQNWTDLLLTTDQLKPIALFFMRLSMIAGQETLETMLDYIVGTIDLDLQEPGFVDYRSPFYEYYFGPTPLVSGQRDRDERASENQTVMAGFWKTLSNLTVLRSRLRDYNRQIDQPLLLSDLIDFSQAHRAANIKILNTSPYQNDDEAVQLMTAFKAKGMEFKAVFLLSVSEQVWGNAARGQINHIGLPPNLQHIRYGGATPDERLRLFYVALTRAKTNLYILNYKQTFSGKYLDRLQYLNEVIDGEQHLSPFLPAGQQQIRFYLSSHTDHTLNESNSPQDITNELHYFWQQRHQSALDNPRINSLLKNRLEHFQLSPTHINSFIDLEHAGPHLFLMNTLLRFPKAPSVNGQFGNAIHETLEWLHLENKRRGSIPNIAHVQTIFEQRLAAKRLSFQDTALLTERGRTVLAAYFDQRLSTISVDNLCERNFRSDGIFIGHAHMTGKIDKLIIDKQNRTITIVDYKTGRSYSRWDGSLKLHKYRQQLYIYKMLVENSTAFRDYRVADAYLEFVEPDDNGTIQELHLSFDEKEYQSVKKLVMVIWRRIQELALPDITAYTPDTKGSLQFEADLLLEDV